MKKFNVGDKVKIIQRNRLFFTFQSGGMDKRYTQWVRGKRK